MWFTPEAAHNHHHDDPRNPDHGRTWKFDITYWLICQLAKVKVVWSIQGARKQI
jgi:fatty-acid desaturase